MPPRLDTRTILRYYAIVVVCGLGTLTVVLLAVGVRRDIDWPKTFEAFAHIAQVVAVAVGGAWTYRLYVRQRLERLRAQIGHVVEFEHFGNGLCLVRVVMEIQNVGSVLLTPPNGSIEVAKVAPAELEVLKTVSDGAKTSDLNWPIVWRLAMNFENDKLALEPGETERYPYDFIITSDVDVIQVHSLVRSGDLRNPRMYWDQTTLHRLPKPPAAGRT